MTQPKYAPITLEDEVRPTTRLAPPESWLPDRPADFRPGRLDRPRGSGSPGPDQGYALRLARRFADRLVLAPSEHAEDVLAGGVVLAMRRASLYGRAPVAADLEVALATFGFLGQADDDLVAERRRFFAGAGHDYWQQRVLADAVPDAVLRRTPAQALAEMGRWRELLAL
ncbi:MAG: hypothetical protein JWM85_1700 [Acidimicrobiaceae bacterium]|nr:hypothetical protein [Acidimicrobiaceae bacterium]